MPDLHDHLEGFADVACTTAAGMLARFLKQSVPICPETLNRYHIENDLRLNGTRFGQRFRERYFDATYNFCLTYDDKLVASLGFDVDVDDSSMTIWQLQGKKDARDALHPIKWERALVHYAVAWARTHEVSEIAMASVDNVSWAQKHGHLSRDRGRMLYDVTARRSGFTRGDDGYWSLRFDASATKVLQ